MIRTLRYFFGALVLLIAVVFLWSDIAMQSDPVYRYVKFLPNNTKSLTLPPFGVFVKQQNKGDRRIEHNDEQDDGQKFWNHYQELGLIGYYKTYRHNIYSKTESNMVADNAGEISEGSQPEIKETEAATR